VMLRGPCEGFWSWPSWRRVDGVDGWFKELVAEVLQVAE
jgi:hypothetical protein